jgi:hypothetical protein
MSVFFAIAKVFCVLCIAHAVAGGLDKEKRFNRHLVFLCYILGVFGLFFDYAAILAALFFLATGQLSVMWENKNKAPGALESMLRVLFTPKIKFVLWVFAILLGASIASRAFGVF